MTALASIAYADIRDLPDAELALLSDDERERHFESTERRRQFLSGRLLARRMLQRRTGAPHASHRILTGDQGKPYCAGGPPLSITHAGGRVACCVADAGDVGIDLEPVGQRASTTRIAKRFFSAAEVDWMQEQPLERFFMLWVLKEACVKAIGGSIFHGLGRLCCRVVPPAIDVLGDLDGVQSLCLFRLGDSYLAVAATAESLAGVAVQKWDAERADFVNDEAAQRIAVYPAAFAGREPDA
jgi:phosphopantetheine--protein transferase-like protein